MPQPQPARPPEAGLYIIRFDQELGLADLRLEGVKALQTVAFRCESRHRPASGSVLRLIIAHSPELDPDRSFLTVSLNYGVLRSVRLDASNRGPVEVAIPLLPSQLRPRNELLLSVEQHTTGRSAAAWTTVSSRSDVEIHFTPDTQPNDLASLPVPLIDPLSYRPQAFDVLIPQQASTATLEATALLIANLLRRVPGTEVSIDPVAALQDAEHPLLIVGTVQEQPELRTTAARDASGSEGVAGFMTGYPRPILFVSGGSASAVLAAARRIALAHRPLSGALTHITDGTPYAPALIRTWTGFLPPENHFTLAAMQPQALELGPSNDYTVRLPLDATPDTRFLPYGAQITLWLKLDAALAGGSYRLQAAFNGSPLGEKRRAGFSADPVLSWRLTVPGSLLRERNELTVTIGDRSSASGATHSYLLPNTTFYLPHDYRADLPDLALLREHFYPFSLRPDFSDTLIVLPDRITARHFSELLYTARALGRTAPADTVAFRVLRRSECTASELGPANIIALGRTGLNLPPSPEGILMRELVSPWNSRRFVLEIAADRGAAETLFSQGRLERLSGDSVYGTSGRLECGRLLPARSIEEVAYFIHLEAWMRANWLALPVILTVVSGVLLVGVRIALDHYKSSRNGATYPS